ncbi:MAG: ATP-binding protein, partial [candidate division KSB1 bacterium]|nr:ATP-binding protein [candidate division KSB1 bacterium]
EEFLRHHGHALPDRLERLTSAKRSELEHAFHQYLKIGGFPEAQPLSDADRFALLRQYVDVAVLRDVMERHDITNITALRWLVRHLLGNPAGLFSAEKFYRDLKSQGIAVSRDTIHQMIAALEDCFLVRICWLDTASERRRMVNPRKVYPVDPGFIRVFDRMGKADVGHALETAVRIELERRTAEAAYVKTAEGYEVDFLAKFPDGRRELIQVCADLEDPDTLQREIRALEAARSEYPNAELRLITLTPDIGSGFSKSIRVTAATEWFLG